jgi:hypothetical protein
MTSKDMPSEVRKYIASADGYFWKILEVTHEGDSEGDEKWDRWQIVTHSFLKTTIMVKTFYIDYWCQGRRVSEFTNEIWVGDMKRWLDKINREGVA